MCLRTKTVDFEITADTDSEMRRACLDCRTLSRMNKRSWQVNRAYEPRVENDAGSLKTSASL